MFKILVTTKFCDRVVNYAQTVREHVGTMREDACQCLTVHAMPRLSRIATDSSRTAHVEFTSSSRHVHEQFTNSSGAVHDYCATVALASVRGYIQGFLDAPRHSRDRQRGDNLYHRDNMPLQESRRNGTTCHDKIVAKSRASVSLALDGYDIATENQSVESAGVAYVKSH